MMKTRELFEEILKHPGLHLGCKSVTRLKAYIDGYMLGLDQFAPSTENFNGSFNKWIARRFRIQTSHDWASIILFMSADENNAFDMTKELWEEFKAETTSHADGSAE